MSDGPDHPNARLIRDLYGCIGAHDAAGAARFYAPDATFRDIAFRWKSRVGIAAMWRYICSPSTGSEIETRVDSALADDKAGLARTVSFYFMDAPGFGRHRVENHIVSTFEFRDGLIVAQRDSCDPVIWAEQAFGPGAFASIVGRSGKLRWLVAMIKVGVFSAKEKLGRA